MGENETLARLKGKENEALVRLKGKVQEKKLPKLDHGFHKELVIIRLNKGNKGFKDNKISFIVGIAGLKTRREDAEETDDFNDEQSKTIEITIILLSKDYAMIRSLNQLQLSCIGGLIPDERMYEACYFVSSYSQTLVQQITQADLPAWPTISDKITPAPPTLSLNDN